MDTAAWMMSRERVGPPACPGFGGCAASRASVSFSSASMVSTVFRLFESATHGRYVPSLNRAAQRQIGAPPPSVAGSTVRANRMNSSGCSECSISTCQG